MARHWRAPRAPSTHPFIDWMIAGACAACIAFVVVLFFSMYSAGKARGQEHPNCAGWINHSCCCTNNCCFEVEPGTVEQITADTYRVIASGQIIKRTGWSKDGRFMRCACDMIGGKWTVHPKAHTRCIYPPQPMM